MPRFLEDRLKREYPNNPKAVWGTMNKMGVVKGNKITKKGQQMEKKHEEKLSRSSPRMSRT